MTAPSAFRVGTRGSPLALAQTGHVIEKLKDQDHTLARKGAVETVAMTTTGDRVQDKALAAVGGKGLFTKELDEALLDGRIDIAVHSMKDMPTIVPDGIALYAILEREDPRDAFISNKAASLADLPAGATVGTSSLRRRAQVLARRPDLRVVALRGNVGTRLRKLEDGEADATLLAFAGLKRLGQADAATSLIEADDILPAVAQGALAATCRADDLRANSLLSALAHPPTTARVMAERALLAVLDGSCQTPIAALAEITGTGRLMLRGLIAHPDGTDVYRIERTGAAAEAEQIGGEAAQSLLAEAGPDVIKAIKAQAPAIIRPHPEMEREG
jgi:hydroxymethylbilane synthase